MEMHHHHHHHHHHISVMQLGHLLTRSSLTYPEVSSKVCQDSFCQLENSVSLKGKSLPQQVEVAQGVPGRLSPRIFLTFRHYKGGRSSAIRTGRLYPRRNPWYSLSEAESTSGAHGSVGGSTEKILSDTIGNRSRDRQTSSTAP